MREIINKLILTNKTISTMESCTGGGLANEITSYEDASKVLKFSAVTYSNEYKIKMGVDEEIINKYIKDIKNLNSDNKSDSKQFFILINQIQDNNKEDICVNQLNDKYFKIKEALARCGNNVYSVNTKEETKKILEKYFFIKNDFSKGGCK